MRRQLGVWTAGCVDKFNVSVTLDRCLLSTEHVYRDSQSYENALDNKFI